MELYIPTLMTHGWIDLRTYPWGECTGLLITLLIVAQIVKACGLREVA